MQQGSPAACHPVCNLTVQACSLAAGQFGMTIALAYRPSECVLPVCERAVARLYVYAVLCAMAWLLVATVTPLTFC
jgi:hypothetical protein